MATKTDISTLGEFGLIRELTKGFENRNTSTVRGIGDDAAVIGPIHAAVAGAKNPDAAATGATEGEDHLLLTTDMLLEGVDFDLVYFPLKHLGYKAVVGGINDIYAMNGTPRQITVSIGASARFAVEDLIELYEGVRVACEEYGVDLVGGDTGASVNGLAISVTALGTATHARITYRNGAQLNDLICITGDLGAAYMGLHLLEREKRALAGVDNPQPDFGGMEYLLERQLRPRARRDIIEALEQADLVPTSMIDLSDGLASDLLHICRSSSCGARIYLERIPIARQTYAMAEQLNADPVVAALNGGDDHELLFTVPLARQEEVARLGGVEIIGHIVRPEAGAALVTPDGSEIALTAPGHK
ncbi:MAG: thiamine-phosphate kinase [Rikenellaceae bacterium]|nr:thiamine-phosphate kinase [Rikenellaceae bacterium]